MEIFGWLIAGVFFVAIPLGFLVHEIIGRLRPCRTWRDVVKATFEMIGLAVVFISMLTVMFGVLAGIVTLVTVIAEKMGQYPYFTFAFFLAAAIVGVYLYRHFEEGQRKKRAWEARQKQISEGGISQDDLDRYDARIRELKGGWYRPR